MEYAWDNNGNTPGSTTNANTVVNSGAGTFTIVPLNTCLTASNPASPNSVAQLLVEEIIEKPTEESSVIEDVKTEETEAKPGTESAHSRARMAAPLSGETVTVSGAGAGFSLPPNKSTTITFSATISSVPSSCSITNQATITGSNFATVQSNITTTNVVVPSPTSVLPSAAVTLCSGNSVTLSASCPTGSSVQWYNAAASNTLLGTGSPLVQSPITSTTYQAACLIGGCESSRVNTALVTVFTTPSAPTNLTATPANRTSVGPVSLTASGCAGTLSWYDVSNSAVALASNNIPNLATTTTFFARCSANACLGPPSTTLTVSVVICTSLVSSPGNVSITWTGLAGTDWNTPCNWSPAWVPDLTNALAIIPNTTNKPIITGTVPDVKAIDIQTNALLTVSGTGVLNVRGDGGTNKGIWINKGALTNASGGIINIQSSANAAVDAYIYLTTDSGTGASFTNSGTVTINSTDEAIGVGLSAIQPAQISNTATGIINIVNGIGVEMNAPTDVLNFVNAGIINYNGAELALKLLGSTTFNNTGTININSGKGIQNPAGSIINNNACGKILMATGTYSNSGTTTNLGLIQLPNTYNFTNTGNFNNNGILKANSVAGVTNTRVVVTNACPMFSIGGSNDYTIDGVFTSPAATTSAGTYTLSGNRFVADNALPTGLQTLYAKFTRASPACTIVVPFDYTNTKPTAVSVSNTTICLGNSVTLTGACSAGNLIWYTSATGSASIGSGSGLVQSPSVTTTYYAACETANCAGGRVATSEVTVLPIPTAPTAANVSICTGTVASLTASCGGGGSVKWYDAATGGTFLSASNPYTTTALTAQTDFYAACETAGVVCVSPTRTKVTVSINPLPVATLTSSGGSGTITCTNPSLTLTATGGNSYVFAGPGVSSFNGTAGTAVVNAGGIYSVTVTNTATGCSSVTSTTISSNTAAPSLTVNPTSATLTCLITSVTLTASGGGTSYAWTGSTSGATKMVSVSGVYSVTATAPNGCTNTTTATVFSNTAAPTLTVNPGSGILTCTVRSLTLTASTSGTGVRWNTTETTPSIVISTSGTYSVTATASNGCLSTSSVSVINDFSAAPPTPTLSANSSVVCEGTNVQVIASGSNLSVQWYRNGSPVAGQTSATLSLGGVQVAQAGSYVLVVSGACSVTSTPFSLTVNPLPTISLLVPNNASVQGATITLPAPLTGINFQVLGGISFERLIILDRINGFEIRQVDQNTNGVFPINRPGPFRLNVTDGNGCKRTVEGVIVQQ